MEIRFRKKNKTIIIMVSGEIDHHTSKELKRQTESAFIEMGAKNIIFHFEKVTFMDSSGIGMLIGRYKQLLSVNGRICIIAANEKITEIILFSGLSTLIPLFDTIEDAFSYTEGREHHAV